MSTNRNKQMVTSLNETEQRCINALRDSPKPLTHRELVKAVWQIDFKTNSNRLQVLICRLREKHFDIRTHRGFGYSMSSGHHTENSTKVGNES